MGKRKRQIVHAEIVTRFAARLRETRLGAGMTQEELGRRAHVTKSYVGRLESGGRLPASISSSDLPQPSGRLSTTFFR